MNASRWQCDSAPSRNHCNNTTDSKNRSQDHYALYMNTTTSPATTRHSVEAKLRSKCNCENWIEQVQTQVVQEMKWNQVHQYKVWPEMQLQAIFKWSTNEHHIYMCIEDQWLCNTSISMPEPSRSFKIIKQPFHRNIILNLDRPTLRFKWYQDSMQQRLCNMTVSSAQ